MNQDPIWSTKGLTDKQKVLLCEELAEKREREATSSCPSSLSAAKLSSERLKLIDHQVRILFIGNAAANLTLPLPQMKQLEVQTGSLGLVLHTKGGSDSAIRASLSASLNVWVFFRDVLKLDLYDVLLNLELYVCTRREGEFIHFFSTVIC